MNFNQSSKSVFNSIMQWFRNKIFWIIFPLIIFISMGIIGDPIAEDRAWEELNEMEKYQGYYRETPPLSKWWLITFLFYPLGLMLIKINIQEKSNPLVNKLINYLYGITLTILLLGICLSAFLSIYCFTWLLSGCPDNWWK